MAAVTVPSTQSTISERKEAAEAPYTPDRGSSYGDVAEKEQVEGDGPRMEELTKTDSQLEYPPPAKAAIVMIAIILAVFLVALDRMIIATAVPEITNEFKSLDDVGWYGSAFFLTTCASQLLLGRIYTYYTPKYVFLAIILLFEVGSVICGAAPNSVAFIIGRAIAGLGAGGIMSGGIVLMTNNIPLAKRPMWQGFFGAVFGIASVAGPLLGGAFTTNVTWRWCFYINLPIGAVVLAVLVFILEPTTPSKPGIPLKQQLLHLDPLGTFFLVPSIVCLLLALQWGGTTYAWNDGRIIALWVVFVVTFIAFVAVQVFMQETATIPSSVIKNRSILAGMWFTFCLASGMMIIVFYVPIWFQAIKGVSAVQSGINLLPLMLSLVIGTISAGSLTSRLGYYTAFACACSIIVPIGAGMITTWNADTGSDRWIGFQVLYGFGLGLGMQQGSLAAQTVLKRQDVPTGVSLMFLCQSLAGAIFVSVGQNVLTTNLVNNLVGQLPNIDTATIINTGATDIRRLVSDQDLPILLNGYNSAFRQVFYVAVGMASAAALGAFSLEWKSVKKAKDGKVGAKAVKAKPEENV